MFCDLNPTNKREDFLGYCYTKISILSWDEIFSDATMNFLSITLLNRGLSFASTPLPLHLALFLQRCRVNMGHIIRSAALPRPLPLWHVQALCRELTASEDNTTFHCRAEGVPLLNSPSTRFTIAPTIWMICKYNQTHLALLSPAQHKAEICWTRLHFCTPLSKKMFFF